MVGDRTLMSYWMEGAKGLRAGVRLCLTHSNLWEVNDRESRSTGSDSNGDWHLFLSSLAFFVFEMPMIWYF
jgi:hypothetical protein